MRPLHVAVALGAIGVAVVLYLALSTSDATAAKGDAASKAAAEARSPERAEASGAMPRAEEPVPSGGPIPVATESAASRAAIADDPKAAPADAPRPAKVTGRVLDYDGSPAAGVKIRVLAKQGFSVVPPDAETDADGRFTASVSIAKKKRTMRLRVARKDRLPIVIAELALRRDETTDVGDLRFEPSGALEVHVVDGAGRAVPNARVEIEPSKPDPASPHDAGEVDFDRAFDAMRRKRASDEEGLAVFEAIPTGRQNVNVRRPMSAGLASSPDVAVGAREVKVTVSTTEPESTEAPVHRSVDIQAGRRESIDIVFRGLGVLAGRATLHGTPVANEWLGLHESSASGSFVGQFGSHVRARTDGEGRFTFPPVPPGEYAVKKGDPGPTVRIEGFASFEDGGADMAQALQSLFGHPPSDREQTRFVEVVEGRSDVSVDFSGAAIDVVVQDADDGTPIAGAVVRLFDPPPARKPNPFEPVTRGFFPEPGAHPVRLRAVADARGRAAFQDLQPGKYRLVARTDDRPPSAPADVDLAENGSARASLRMAKSQAVRGTVNDRAGNAIADAMVVALPSQELEPSFPGDFSFLLGAPRIRTTSDAKGAFTLKGVERGSHKLVAFSKGLAPAAIDASAPSDGNHFFLEKSGSIRVVARRNGAPAPAVRVRLRFDDQPAIPPEAWMDLAVVSMGREMPSSSELTDENGVAVLKGIPPGDWTVQIGSDREFDSAEWSNAPEIATVSVEKSGGESPGPAPVKAEPTKSLRRRVTVAPDRETDLSVEL